jgi:hypothetical protein
MKSPGLYNLVTFITLLFTTLYLLLICVILLKFLNIVSLLTVWLIDHTTEVYLTLSASSAISFILWLFLSFHYAYKLGGFGKPKIAPTILAMLIPVANVVILYFMINELMVRLDNRDFTTPLRRLSRNVYAMGWVAFYSIFWVTSFISVMMAYLVGLVMLGILLISVIMAAIVQLYLVFKGSRLLKHNLLLLNQPAEGKIYDSLIIR